VKDEGNILTNFLNALMPGLKATDQLKKIPSLFSSRNPDALLRMDALTDAKIPCVDVASNETNCPEGFELEPTTGKNPCCVYFDIVFD